MNIFIDFFGRCYVRFIELVDSIWGGYVCRDSDIWGREVGVC